MHGRQLTQGDRLAGMPGDSQRTHSQRHGGMLGQMERQHADRHISSPAYVIAAPVLSQPRCEFQHGRTGACSRQDSAGGSLGLHAMVEGGHGRELRVTGNRYILRQVGRDKCRPALNKPAGVESSPGRPSCPGLSLSGASSLCVLRRRRVWLDS
jgi:hypothetical protein